MNFQNILIQCSLNQMIIIHMILDINLFYIQLPTKTSTGWLCIRYYISELLTQTPECLTEKLDTQSLSVFSDFMKNYYIQNCNKIVWLKIVIFAKTNKGILE